MLGRMHVLLLLKFLHTDRLIVNGSPGLHAFRLLVCFCLRICSTIFPLLPLRHFCIAVQILDSKTFVIPPLSHCQGRVWKNIWIENSPGLTWPGHWDRGFTIQNFDYTNQLPIEKGFVQNFIVFELLNMPPTLKKKHLKQFFSKFRHSSSWGI